MGVLGPLSEGDEYSFQQASKKRNDHRMLKSKNIASLRRINEH